MIKLIIFDLDGVLVNTKKIHYKAFNLALKKNKTNYQINFTEHVKKFEGLPTKEKIKILIKEKKISEKYSNRIYLDKQKLTSKLLKKEVKYNHKTYKLFKKLKKNFNIAVATNSINSTLNACIKNLKIKKYIDFSLGTNQIKHTKPHPEIYLKCLIEFGYMPRETLIIEDSYVGRLAAKESSCNLMPIKEMKEVNYSNIMKNIDMLNKQKTMAIKKYWEDENLNILIPMAGAGSRFVKAGYTFPKPLIEIHGKPMIQWVVDSIQIKANYIFIIQSSQQKKYNLKSLLKALKPNCKIIDLDKITKGAACTTLLAKKFINNSKPLLIANSDQFVEWNSAKTMYNFVSKNVDGGILVFNSIHPKWSYAKTVENDLVEEVAEKKVISNKATVGIYYWKKGSDYVKYANEMINKKITVNNEYYVCPVYNQAIKDKKKVITVNVDKMWGLGTPEDLKYFEQNFKI